MLSEKTIDAFLEALASAEPTPGGGSTAALVGALASALVSMVCRLTIGKRRFQNVEEALCKTLGQAEALRKALTDLIDQDAAAYQEVMAAYRLPADTPEAKDRREAALQKALEAATQVPFEIAERCVQIISLAMEAAQWGNPWAVTDAGAAVLLAEAALRAALLNVHINLQSLHDPDALAKARSRLAALEEQAKRDHVLAVVQERIQGIQG